MHELLSRVLGAQTKSGAFPSIAQLPGGPVVDENAFVTALVLDILSHDKSSPEIAAACRRGVDFLLRCESPGLPGAFSFYPVNGQPDWIQELLPPDADDTALCALALYSAGYWPQDKLRHVVWEVLSHHRLQQKPDGAPWFQAGVYPTWLDSRRQRNPIDICVNINVATLMRKSTVDKTYYQGIMDLAEAALKWAGADRERLQKIMPFYPHVAELGFAIQRALSAGVSGAEGLWELFNKLPAEICESDVDTPVCCSIGTGVVWVSPALQMARSWLSWRLAKV